MFAVTGWNLTAPLKTQTEPIVSIDAPAADATQQGNKKKGNKRKRGGVKVTGDNVAELWERVIEGKKDSGKKRKLEGGQTASGQEFNTEAGVQKAANKKPDPASEKKREKNRKRKEQRERKKEFEEQGIVNGAPNATSTTAAAQTSKSQLVAKLQHAAQPSAQPKLTALQASMARKLTSARFRHMNETLYTTPSANAFALFKQSPDMFNEYHAGFRQQVEVWPSNPVDVFLQEILTRGKTKPPRNNKSRNKKEENPRGTPPPTSPIKPLPRNRNTGVSVIADLGCGDAKLSQGLQSHLKRLNASISSFDLASNSPLVTVADISSLPLEAGSVDVTIFCLALMGTNWLSFIDEAYRVLHWKGELWIAEIKSRFGRVGAAKTTAASSSANVVDHSVGKRRKPGARAKAQNKNGEDDEDDVSNPRRIAQEIDPATGATIDETDIEPFIAILQKRGFILDKEEGVAPSHLYERDGVDKSNKMFVRFRFLKAAKPLRGSNVKVVEEEDAARAQALAMVPRGGKRFLNAQNDEEEEVDEEKEGRVLKPCMYKIR